MANTMQCRLEGCQRLVIVVVVVAVAATTNVPKMPVVANAVHFPNDYDLHRHDNSVCRGLGNSADMFFATDADLPDSACGWPNPERISPRHC